MSGGKGPSLSGTAIIRATSGELIAGHTESVAWGVSTDSRTVDRGNLFIPLIGERFNGHEFLAEAIAKGASALLIQKSELSSVRAIINSLSDAVQIIAVENTLKALGDIAHFWRELFSAPLLAITGSSGKTTAKEMAAAILGIEKRLLKNEGNFNNLIGLPLSVLKMNAGHEAVILEMGTNHPGEIARLTEIADPTVGLITNIGSAHLEGLKSLEAVREEKGDLFKGLRAEGVAVVNNDDPVLRELSQRRKGPAISYAIRESADVRADRIRMEKDRKNHFNLIIGSHTEEVVLNAPGLHNIYNALAAAASAWRLGIAPEVICQGLERFQAVPGRMEVIALRNGAFLINDAYNANPDSVEAALRTLMDLKGEEGSALVALGDMLELGDQALELHKKIGLSIGIKGVHRLFVKGEFARQVAEGAIEGGMHPDRIVFSESSDMIAQSILPHLKKGDWVLVKGSRRMKMEEISRNLSDVIGITETKN